MLYSFAQCDIELHGFCSSVTGLHGAMFWLWSDDKVASCLAKFDTKLHIIHIELELGQLIHYTNWATCWMVWGLMSGRGKHYHYSLKHSGSEADPASYSVGTGCSFLGDKVVEVW